MAQIVLEVSDKTLAKFVGAVKEMDSGVKEVKEPLKLLQHMIEYELQYPGAYVEYAMEGISIQEVGLDNNQLKDWIELEED